MKKDEALMEVLKQFNEYRQTLPRSNAILPIEDLYQLLEKQPDCPAVELPCGKKVTRLVPASCLMHILTLTPHPKVGHPVFWKVEIIVKSEERGTIIASVDPIMLEATGLPKARLGAHLTRKIKELSDYLPDIRLDVVVQEEIQQVIGVLKIKGQPEKSCNCEGEQPS